MEPVLKKAKQAPLSRSTSLAQSLEAPGPREDRGAVHGERPDVLGRNEMLGLTDLERGALAEIDAALARIERGTFGRCEACAGAIGRHRLRAVPQARLCLECASCADAARS